MCIVLRLHDFDLDPVTLTLDLDLDITKFLSQDFQQLEPEQTHRHRVILSFGLTKWIIQNSPKS